MKRSILRIWACLAIVVALFIPASVSADIPIDSNCPNLDNSLNVLTILPRGKFDVYAKISPEFRAKKVTVYEQDSRGYCNEIINTPNLTDKWTAVVQNHALADSETSLIATISGSVFDQGIEERPLELMMVPASMDTKFAGDQPTIILDSQQATVIPRTSYRQDGNLRISYFEPMNTSDIQGVNYVIDGKLAYSLRDSIADDTYKYLSQYYNSKELRKEVFFKSGDKAVISSDFKVETITFSAYLAWIFRQIPPVIFVLFVALALMITSTTLLMIASAIYKQRLWHINHGLAKSRVVVKSSTKKLFEKIYQITSVLKKLTIIIVGVTLVVIMVLGNMVDIFRVDGPSMQNTLQDNQRLAVYKANRKLHKLFTGKPYVPGRGDVVIINLFDYNTNWLSRAVSFQEKNTVVKRVIGLPGETVHIEGDDVTVTTVDGQVLHPDHDSSWDSSRIIEYRRQHITVTLGSDEVFVLGDNRPESIDSRYLGPIKTQNIIGEKL